MTLKMQQNRNEPGDMIMELHFRNQMGEKMKLIRELRPLGNLLLWKLFNHFPVWVFDLNVEGCECRVGVNMRGSCRGGFIFARIINSKTL